jgi:hypothetical protein
LREIRGAVHVHSRYSDGTGSVDEIVEAAQAARLDFVILTDHDTIGAAEDGHGGRYGGVLLAIGAEVSPRERGHCLALGESLDVRAYRWMPERYYLPKLRRQGADVYIAHPEGRVKSAFGINLRQWHVWESEHFDGIEIWSYMHDWVDNVTALTLPYYYLRPDRAIEGPDEGVLGLWDRLNVRRRVAGLGALDAHAIKRLGGLFTAFPYRFLFGTILTHVFVEEWGGSAAADAAALRAALREARSFAAYDALAPAEGFRFYGDGGLMMGDRAQLGAGRRLAVEAPREADVTLVHNGRRVRSESGGRTEFEASSPGVYRVEARIGGRPWVFSNPIFLW